MRIFSLVGEAHGFIKPFIKIMTAVNKCKQIAARNNGGIDAPLSSQWRVMEI